MCKAFFDTHTSQKLPITNETAVGITEWIKNMRECKEWLEGDMYNHMLMTCCHLSTTQMKTERNYISQYGAVRMAKEESIEMITNNMRYHNFWIHVTVYEKDEERGGKIQKL
eukprot:10269804-Heterocapsa_arctica.AAC.1